MRRADSGLRTKPGRRAARALTPFGLVLLLAFSSAASGQPTAAGKPRGPEPRVYLDCPQCDLAFVEVQIPFARFVRSAAEAQVEVEIRSAPADARQEYILSFRGRGEFAGDDDELSFRPERTAKPEEVRDGLVQILKLGLLRYAGRLPVSSRISIQLLDTVKPTSVADRWKAWVFSVSGSSFLNGEKSYKDGMYWGSLSANRVTPEWKIRLAFSGSYQKDRFTYEDSTLLSSSDSRRFIGLAVRSLGDHWSVGGFFEALSSTYANTLFSATPAPAVEYDLFPYAESTQRQFRFLYRLNLRWVRYHETTIYGKTSERLLEQALSASLELKRPWGTISASLQGSNYFHDFSKNRLEAWSEVSLRLFKGFSFNIQGGASRIHDQLSLPAQGATLEEILLRRRQLETSYDYHLSVGLSFTFGSTESRVVNPRFGDGAGGVPGRIVN